MVNFSQYTFEELLPPYLTGVEKGRLKLGLNQFIDSKGKDKALDYSDFFLANSPNYLLQSDLLHSVKMCTWDEEYRDFVSGYTQAVFISNTCDINLENNRAINKKEALFAPVIAVKEYCKDLEAEGFAKNHIFDFYNALRRQEFSNLFYLPKNEKNDEDYIVFFDKISWFPITELLSDSSTLNDIRYISLSNYGFYLFILKLSYHFCRIPEELDRKAIQ